MTDYQRILEKEQNLKKLNQFIYQQAYLKNKEKVGEKIEKILQELQILQSKINYFEKKRKIRREVLNLEQERYHYHSKQIAVAKDQAAYFHSKTEKGISEKFIQKYQKEMSDLGSNQKEVQSRANQLKEQENELIEQLEKEKAVFKEKTEPSRKEYERLLKEQDSNIEGLEEKFITQFQYLRKKKIYPAVISVKNAYCSECAITFPPQIFQEVLSYSYSLCPNCNRLLVVDKEYLTSKAKK